MLSCVSVSACSVQYPWLLLCAIRVCSLPLTFMYLLFGSLSASWPYCFVTFTFLYVWHVVSHCYSLAVSVPRICLVMYAVCWYVFSASHCYLIQLRRVACTASSCTMLLSVLLLCILTFMALGLLGYTLLLVTDLSCAGIVTLRLSY